MALRPPKKEITYCFLEKDPEDVDDEVGYPIPLVDGDLFHYEMEVCGLFYDEHLDFFRKLAPGYYKIEYTKGTDGESCDGHKLYEWDVVEEYLSATPSHYARWLAFKNNTQNRWSFFLDHFRPIWSIDWDYGGAGITSNKLYLPTALFYKIWNCKNFPKWGYTPSWGPGFTSTRIRKNW